MPELPSVATHGEIVEEATEMAKEVSLKVMHDDDLPIPTVHRNSVAISEQETASRLFLEPKRTTGSS